MKALISFLEHIAYNLRVSSLTSTTAAGSGHPTSALSAADIIATLFFYVMCFDPKNPANPDNDRFILSKGHASPVLYAVLKELKVITQDDLLKLRSFDSVLEGHPTPRCPFVDVATGSLGQGLSMGIGMALSARLDQRTFRTFVLLGDSEIAEGQVWEAAEIAAYYQLNNLIGIVDANRLGQSTETIDDHHMAHYLNKFTAFGWQTMLVDGHNIYDLMQIFDKTTSIKNKPIMIIAKTYKGYGVDIFENKEGFHGKVLSQSELSKALGQLTKRFLRAAQDQDYHWKPKLPDSIDKEKLPLPKRIDLSINYNLDELVATRKVYGQILTQLGHDIPQIVALDAEVKNSTYAELFEKKYPKRFFQCFVAEQNMMSMGVGLASRGKIPFISTFGAFLTRAFDQLRMAAISRSALRIVGSHAGVSIGQDGPSQMALEDIALMRTLPNSIIFHPCDAVSTAKVICLMATYYDGISYLRTLRSETPVIYSIQEDFSIGGCKILRSSKNDIACVIASGITVFEALKAYEELKKKNIFVSIIDLYGIKPLDTKTIIDCALRSGKKVVTIEDHYLAGGMGESISYAIRNHNIQIHNLAVTKLPQSGSPEKLREYEHITSSHVIQALQILYQDHFVLFDHS